MPDLDPNRECAAWMPEPDVSGHAPGEGRVTAGAVFVALIGLAVLALGAGLVMMT